MMQILEIIIVILVIAALFGFFIWLLKRLGLGHVETEEKKAGRRGEEFATAIIREILKEDDTLITNRHLLADGMVTELDNLVINSYGVFIVEVKNYYGRLDGAEDDDAWVVTQNSSGGTFRQKTVKNPINQVKRQIDILGRYFRQHGIECRIKGYVFFVQMNSPVKSAYILETQGDIDRALHTAGRAGLSPAVKNNITNIMRM